MGGPSAARPMSLTRRAQARRPLPSGKGLGRALLPLLVLLLAGCASVHQVQFARLDGSRCEMTHARAVWYSGAEWVDCVGKDGKATTIQTNHTDVGMMTGPGEALIGAGAMASWAPLLITH